MLRTYRSLSLALSAVAAAGAVIAQEPMAKPGNLAPAFSSTGSDGKTHTLLSLTEKGPVVLYFIKEDCPVNADALPFYSDAYRSLMGKANFIGVFDGDAKRYAKWKAATNAPFPVLLDPQMKIIRSYRALRSPWTIEVGKDGRMKQIWAGYSQKELRELVKTLSANAGVPTPSVEFAGAPKVSRFGCQFEMD